ncbi:HdeD family acid-resistance protein [Acuticoccus sp. M5D2P5]|uniref:HdeD family acid-resistance protein n=1 Tax=Acuticoccus kalidii TaxID=2910977 RepID=UPI001F44C6BD|nr:HdeD family acid-resistance protein [Acuticoccus kalidii]MCF3933734.1 HdeD family acid-resistance protein [Acuticoccus kalidii]
MVESAVAAHRTWFVTLGLVLIVLGVVALIFPFVTTIATKIFIGWLFLVGGIVQVVHAFSTQKWSAFFLDLLVGVLYVLAGVWLAFFPLAGLITLTLFICATFIVQGVLEGAMAIRLRPVDGWGWLLASGIVSVAAGILIAAHLPSSAAWAIGLLVGINMITSGWAYFFLGLTADKAV